MVSQVSLNFIVYLLFANLLNPRLVADREELAILRGAHTNG